MRIVSGVQPSGPLHLGNWLGAVRQFLRVEAGDEALYFIADLHALTTVHDGARLRQLSFGLAKDLLALGVQPARMSLFRQSDVPQVLELAWLLATVWPKAVLERAHAYKDKVRQGLSPSVGLFTYPVLMAADILVLGAERVPVGRDQTQHLELARDAAVRLGTTYGVPELLRLPTPLVLDEVAVVPGTDGRKMSKSYGNTLDLFAPEPVLERRILSLKTDSTPVEAPKPLDSPLLALLTLLCPAEEAAEHRRTFAAGGVGYATYKRRLLARFLEVFAGPRRRRAELEQRPGEVEQHLAAGARHARELAGETLGRVRRVVGLG